MEPREVVSWFANQHLRIRSIFDEMDVTKDPVPLRRLATHLAAELEAHAAVEGDLLYPLLQNARTGASEWMQHARLVHQSIASLTRDLLTTDWSAERLRGFRDMVARCLDDEEMRIFPSIEALDDGSAGELLRRIADYERHTAAER